MSDIHVNDDGPPQRGGIIPGAVPPSLDRPEHVTSPEYVLTPRQVDWLLRHDVEDDL